MQPEVIAAIITGITTIIGPIITYIVIKRSQEKNLQEVGERRRVITGTWRGNIEQLLNNQPTSIPLEITFTAKERLIEGLATLTSPIDHSLIKLRFTGGFHYDRFIKFDYKNEDECVMQFGSSIMDLHADGRTLTGKFVGYGTRTNQIVSGNALLLKAP